MYSIGTIILQAMNFITLPIFIRLLSVEEYGIFSKAILLNNQFPAELLSIVDIKFEKVITLFSTSVMVFENNVDIDFYGTEIHPKLLERFGLQDSIMKKYFYKRGK